MPGKELRFITIAYGIAAILVVLGHSHPLHRDYPTYIGRLIKFIYTFHMPLFFFIAGMLIRYTDHNRSVPRWWWEKVKKLMIPYIVLSAVAWLPKVLLDSFLSDNMELSATNILRMIFIPRDGVWGHFWFIPTYLILSLIGACCCKLPNNLVINAGMIGGGILLLVFPINTDWIGLRDVSLNLLYILAGVAASRYLISNQLKYGKPSVAALTFIVSLCIFILSQYVGSNDKTVLYTIVAFGMIFFILVCSILLSNKKNRGLKYVGGRAFTVFIYSWPVQITIEMVCVMVLKLNWAVVFGAMFTVGLLFPLLLYEFYLRCIPRRRFLDALVGINKN